MKRLQEVCLGPKNHPLSLEMIRISLRSWSNTQSLRRWFAVSDGLSSFIWWYVYASASRTYHIIPLLQSMSAPSIDDRYCNHSWVLCFVNQNKFKIIFIHLELLMLTVYRD